MRQENGKSSVVGYYRVEQNYRVCHPAKQGSMVMSRPPFFHCAAAGAHQKNLRIH
jgi:type IV secretory pathway protease TraF